MIEEKKSPAKNKNRAANQAAIALVSETYPLAFNRENVRPLKIGIQEDLVADGKIPQGKIKRALASYVRMPQYYKSLKEGAERVDLAGVATGAVTEKEAEHAKALLKKIRDQRNERIKQEREAQRQQKKQEKKQRQEQREERFNNKLEQLLSKST